MDSRNISTKLLRTLNGLVVDEFNAIHHYMAHSAVCGGWGYKVLENKFEEESKEELGHSKKLMDRIAVFDKVPTLNQFPAVERPGDVKSMIEKQVELEKGALDSYNKAIILARQEGDNGTRDVLIQNLLDEERHWDWLKAQLDKIEQMGLSNYLLSQVGEEETEKAMGVSAMSPMAVESLDDKLKMPLTQNSPRSAGGKALSGAGRSFGSENPVSSTAGGSSVNKSLSASIPLGIKPSLRYMSKK